MNSTFYNQELLNKLIEYDEINYEQESLENPLSLWIESIQKYYDINKSSEISDLEFDDLDIILKERYKNDSSEIGKQIYLLLINGISTTEGIKVNHNNHNNTVVSETLQVSLKKIKYDTFSKTNIDIKKFFNRFNYNNNRLFFSPKLDGISIKLFFDDSNQISKIQTRGGQDVTSQLIYNKSIRKLTDINHNNKFIHGELVITKKVFNEKYSQQYENMRNCIVGIMKTNPEDLVFVPCTNGIEPIFLQDKLWNEYKFEFNLEQIYHTMFKTANFQFLTDGIVIGYVLEDKSKFEIVNNYPTNIVAIKFKSESKPTKVIDIEWTIKKSGKLTPILHINPIELDGSIIRKVSGYSYYNLISNKIGIGSEVKITKSGDIIPIVSKVITRSNNYKLPTNIDYKINGKHLINNSYSDDIKINKFINGLKLLELNGIGPIISTKIGDIFDYNIIELFNPNKSVDVKLLLGDNSSVWNIFKTIYNIKKIPLDLLIEIMQFDNCGKTLSKRFANIILGINKDYKNINKELLKSVCSSSGKYNQIIKESIATLKTFGISVIKPIQVSENSFTFEMSGDTPSGLTKDKFVELLKQKNPNAIHTTLTKDIHYLIVDNLSSNTSKANKARKYNIKLLTYEEALKYDFSINYRK